MTTVLRVESLSKIFGGTHALLNADFELRQGEIHALVGENGAGKSTLIKILSGVHQKDGGRMLLDGKPIDVDSPAEASRLGMAVIYQDFDLAPNLSVADNLLLGREPTSIFAIVDRKEHRRRAEECLAKAGLTIDPNIPVGDLTVAERQLVAIAKALSQEARILIMDEPTSALAADEIERLIKLARKLSEDGTSIAFVSHKLDEVFEVSDRVTVFRDGRAVGTRVIGETSPKEIASMMVGRELEELYHKQDRSRSEELLQVRGMCRHGEFAEISFSLFKGEVLGLYGLKGAGRSAIAETLFGLRSSDGGDLMLEGNPVEIDSPQDAIRLGIGFVPEDRKNQALFPNMNVRENLSLPALGQFGGKGFVNRRMENASAAKYMSQLSIKAQGPEQPITDLSGGNQQKVVISRWLVRQPRMLILDEPTAGVDVGVRSEIYGIVDRLASEGVGILLISSELPEILGISDRILVVANGKIVGEFAYGEATEEEVMHAIH